MAANQPAAPPPAPAPPPTGSSAHGAHTAHWAALGEHTCVAGIALLFWLYRAFGRLPLRLCLYPVVLYYWATRAVARRASLEYLTRLQAATGCLGHAPGWRDSLRHFLEFAETILDKLLALQGTLGAPPLPHAQAAAGGADAAAGADGEHGLLALHARGRGALIATGHIGCMELCRLSAQRQRGLRVTMLVHTRHAQRFNRLLARLQPESGLRLIQVESITPGTAMLLADRLAQGEFIALAADRVPLHGGLTAPARFLGQTAHWPAGPYVLAALLRCPLYAMACVRERGGYALRVRCLAQQLVLPRGAARAALLAAQAQQFAGWVESVLERAPLAWFNFFPFWAPPAAAPRTEAHPHER